MTQHIFIISKGETAKESWKRDAGTFALFASLIGIGAFLESSAMQWAGFIIAWFVVFAKASKAADRYMTADEAISRIKEIGAEQS